MCISMCGLPVGMRTLRVQFSGCKWESVLLLVPVGTTAAGGLPLCLHCWGVMLRNFQDYKTLALVHLGRKEPVIRS